MAPTDPNKKYTPLPNRKHVFMTPAKKEEKSRSEWFELEIKGRVNCLSPTIFNYDHLFVLYLNDNSLQKIPPEISKLKKLQHLDISNNSLASLPEEIGDLLNLRTLNLANNHLANLPCEMGKLYKLTLLDLANNRLSAEYLMALQPDNTSSLQQPQKFLDYLLNGLKFNTTRPPPRPWVAMAQPQRAPSAVFTVMNYNVLSDNYCTRALYGYSPSWCLQWDYRKKGILEEIRHYSADIICLQEVEKDQHHEFFVIELEKEGYTGVFHAKSGVGRSRIDGCAIFWRSSKFQRIDCETVDYQAIAVRFSSLSTQTGGDYNDMLNRVQSKDNIGLCVLLETKEGAWEANGVPSTDAMVQPILVATTHVTWEPSLCDVKLIQTALLMMTMKELLGKANQMRGTDIYSTRNVPVLFCGDLNSMPDSGVYDFLVNGRVPVTHEDIQNRSYVAPLQSLNLLNKKHDEIVHSFKLSSVYKKDVMPYTNFTYDFKDIIDYIFHSPQLKPMGVLGPIDEAWVTNNNVMGCPNPHIPSDHFSLLAEFELQAALWSPKRP